MAPQLIGPDNSFTLTYPDGWTHEPSPEGTVLVHRKENGIGTVRITTWRTKGGPKDLDAFVRRQVQQLSKPSASERQVLSMEPLNVEGKRGLFRISNALENGVPVLVTLIVLGGGSTVVMASYTIPVAKRLEAHAKEESRAVIGMMTRIVLR